MTREKYLAALREELKRYPWAGNPDKLDSYIDRATYVVAGGTGPGFENTGAASVAAWRAIGGKGKPTLKALRALPAA